MDVTRTGLWRAGLVAAIGVFFGGTALASPVGFTDRTNFLAAIAGLADETLDFEAMAPGTSLPSGSAVGGITLTYTIAGLDLAVRDDYGTTSGSHYLGLDTFDGVFVSGDAFDMTFGGPIQAVGLSVIGIPGSILAVDFELHTGSGGFVFNSGAPDVLLADGDAFFLGLVDSAGFNTARLASFDPTGTGIFVFNVDDITTAAPSVPEPGTALLLGSGLAGWVWLRHRRRA